MEEQRLKREAKARELAENKDEGMLLHNVIFKMALTRIVRCYTIILFLPFPLVTMIILLIVDDQNDGIKPDLVEDIVDDVEFEKERNL